VASFGKTLDALGKVHVLSGRDLVRGGDYLGRVTQQFPDIEELRARGRATRSNQ
jgi:hypothetical protein